jgi:hypothetical protein
MAYSEILDPPLRRGDSSIFLEDIAKLHEFAQDFDVYKCKTLRLNEPDRLVSTTLVKYSHSSEIRNIFLKTIAAATNFQPRWTLIYFSHNRNLSIV